MQMQRTMTNLPIFDSVSGGAVYRELLFPSEINHSTSEAR